MKVSNIDFEKDLQEAAIAQLERYGVKYKESDVLEDLIYRLFEFWRKYIPPQPYCVVYAKELMEKLVDLPKTKVEAMQKLKEWLEQGIDVNCFQSRSLMGGSRDYLNMLYGMTHLHLSALKDDAAPKIKKNGFSKPSDYILIVKVKGGTVYFIDALKHPAAFEGNIIQPGSSEKWLAEYFVETVNNNWPELLIPAIAEAAKMCDGEGNNIVLDDAARRELVLSRINTGVQLDKGVFFPDGVTGAGTSAAVTIQVNKIINKLKIAERCYASYAPQIINAFSEKAASKGKTIDKIELHYAYIQIAKKYMIVDYVSGMLFDFEEGRLYWPASQTN